MTLRTAAPVLAVLLAGCAPAMQNVASNDVDLAITNVTVIDVERGRAVAGQSVLLKQNRIVAVSATRTVRLPTSTRLIDGTGKFVIPGLLDMHAHIIFSGNPVRIELPLFVAHGVTGVRVMGSDRPNANPALTPGLNQHRGLQRQIEAGAMLGPRLLALASWPVNGPSRITDSMPQYYKARTREEGAQLARYLKERGFDFIKIYNELPREGFRGLAEESRKLGVVFAGHEPSALSAIEISNAGQKSIEHSRIFLFNCFPGADSMRKGLLRTPMGTALFRRMVDEYDAKRCAEVFKVFAANRTYITPTHTTRRMDAFADNAEYRNDPRMKYIPLAQQGDWHEDANGMVSADPSAAGRRTFMDFYTKGLALTNAAYRAGVPVMLGTDAGDTYVFPGSSAHDELGELVKAGLTPAEALRAATLTGATYLGRTADFGTVQAGRMADLVVLDANPLTDIGNTRRINAVVLNGRYLGRSALDSLLTGVETLARPTAQAILWAGARKGDTVAIARGLAGGAKIDSLDPQGNRRPLNYAAIDNHLPALRLLIARGASLNLGNRTGFTAVHHAVEGGAIDALKVLIAAGADISIPSTSGRRPLDTARLDKNTAAVELLEAATRKP